MTEILANILVLLLILTLLSYALPVLVFVVEVAALVIVGRLLWEALSQL